MWKLSIIVHFKLPSEFFCKFADIYRPYKSSYVWTTVSHLLSVLDAIYDPAINLKQDLKKQHISSPVS